MNPSAPARLAALASLIALSSGARADELFAASPDTRVFAGDPYAPDLAAIGACGGIPHSLALVGTELRIGDVTGRVYRWAPGDPFVGYAFDAPNDARALAVHSGDLLSGGSDASVVRLDANTGAVLDTLTSIVPITAMLVSGDDLYLGSSAGVVHRGSALTGGFQFFGTCGGPVASMALDATHLILGSSNGQVYRIDLATQQVDASFAVASDAAAMVLHLGDLLVGGSDGSLVRIERFTGALKSTLGAPGSLSALALLPATDPGTVYCFGTGCPCANDDPGAGCANSTGFGARLAGSGSASVAADDLAIHAFQLPPNKVGRFYMSTLTANLPFGGGLLCTGGGGYPIFRFPGMNSGASGFITTPDEIVGWCSQNLGPQGQITPGSTWNFQAWYRNKQGPCAGQSFNTTNALSVTFLP